MIWYVQTFGFHLAELEVRQHSDDAPDSAHRLLKPLTADPEQAADDAALLDRLAIEGWPERSEPLTEATQEVLDTLRVMSWLQARWGSVLRPLRGLVSHSAANLVAVRALGPASRSGRLRYAWTWCPCSRPAPTSKRQRGPRRLGRSGVDKTVARGQWPSRRGDAGLLRFGQGHRPRGGDLTPATHNGRWSIGQVAARSK